MSSSLAQICCLQNSCCLVLYLFLQFFFVFVVFYFVVSMADKDTHALSQLVPLAERARERRAEREREKQLEMSKSQSQFSARN